MSSKTLTKHCKTDEDKRQFNLDWAASKPAREILYKVLEDKVALVRRLRLEKSNLDGYNFAVQQANFNAQEKCYLELLELLDITK